MTGVSVLSNNYNSCELSVHDNAAHNSVGSGNSVVTVEIINPVIFNAGIPHTGSSIFNFSELILTDVCFTNHHVAKLLFTISLKSLKATSSVHPSFWQQLNMQTRAGQFIKI